MKYYHKCDKCGAENVIFTDRKITEKQIFKCFKCNKKFVFKKEQQ